MNSASATDEPPRAPTRRGARRAALQALYQWQVADTEPDDLLRQFHAGDRLSGVDHAYFDALVRGVVAEASALESCFGEYLDRAPAQLDPVERSVLLLGVFELRERADVPYRVVLDQALELAKRFGAQDGHRYINGVLDRAARALRGSEVDGAT